MSVSFVSSSLLGVFLFMTLFVYLYPGVGAENGSPTITRHYKFNVSNFSLMIICFIRYICFNAILISDSDAKRNKIVRDEEYNNRQPKIPRTSGCCKGRGPCSHKSGQSCFEQHYNPLVHALIHVVFIYPLVNSWI